MPALPIDTDQIVITASRAPEPASQSPASVTVIDGAKIERLGDPLAVAFLRLTPSVAVTSQGPAGLFTEVRIRGAENNHTLLFIDGIRANDPATGDFARFELLNADIASRIEVVRGPQSALWGSDAIGGVIAVNGLDQPQRLTGALEGGSFGFVRASAAGGTSAGGLSLAGALGFQRATGIDSFGSPGGDKDGYRNLSARARASLALSPDVRIGVNGFAIRGRSEFDGYDPVTFQRADTLDNNRNRLSAGRMWAEFGGESTPWRGSASLSLLGSANHNYLGLEPTNQTSGTRRTADVQVERHFGLGGLDHRLIVAAENERETFSARDTIYGGATYQDRNRTHDSLVAEWRVSSNRLAGDVALRHDWFNRFKDSTSLRASALARLGQDWALAGSYAEGIAQPTFFDLYGFFPGNYMGNPSVKPESSRGFELSLRFARRRFAAALTAYRQSLHDEIVDDPTFTTVVNSPATSRRAGIEAELAWQPVPQLRLAANYAYLKATQPSGVANRQVEELRRPRHSGSVSLDGSAGRVSYGASLAYVGSHLDREEVAPYAIVRLDSYWLAGARLAYAVSPGAELFVRGSNLLDSRYEDSAGYRTEGRGIFAGIRLGADRRSSP